ncbi:MAG: hypothetical protein IKB47_01235 [Clostridia bacterium]|nr:hypothetical protein [Clostridia bacterium]
MTHLLINNPPRDTVFIENMLSQMGDLVGYRQRRTVSAIK